MKPLELLIKCREELKNMTREQFNDKIKSLDIKHMCCKCGSENVSIMSVREEIVECDNKKIPTVDIIYICNDCGNTKTVNEYLYRN